MVVVQVVSSPQANQRQTNGVKNRNDQASDENISLGLVNECTGDKLGTVRDSQKKSASDSGGLVGVGTYETKNSSNTVGLDNRAEGRAGQCTGSKLVLLRLGDRLVGTSVLGLLVKSTKHGAREHERGCLAVDSTNCDGDRAHVREGLGEEEGHC